jgi:glycosyltransferase involved in cell wall biosynthesis
MNILHLTHTDIEADSRILKEMAALHGAGFKVSGIGVIMDEETVKVALSPRIAIYNIRLHSRKLTFFPKIIRHTFSLLELIVKMLPVALRECPNVIHCHDTLVLPLACFVKMVTGAKLIYDAHELESDRNGLNLLEGLLILWVEKSLWYFVDVLIVVSPSIKAWYQKNIGQKKTTILFNSPSFFLEKRYVRNYLRKKFTISRQNKVFIYVGQFSLGRGIDLLISTFTDPRISAHIVFLGFGELSSELKRLADQHSNIHVHDAVQHSDIVPILQSADYGLCLLQKVSLSDYYCLPNKLFEYCFAGIPVLASDFPDIRALIKRYKIGVCCKVELDEIHNAVLRLQRKKTVRDFADLTPLSWETQEKKLLNLYRQICS